MRTIQTAIDKAAKILVLFAVSLSAVSLSLPANAQTAYKTIHSFNGPTGGYPSFGDLISDASGNFYGVTSAGGNTKSSLCGNYSGCGVVFKLSKASSGGWSTTTLFVFTGANGFEPQAGLVFDAAGNLYGTTALGGNLGLCYIGCGVVYKLSPTSSGAWKETVLYTFQGSTDGSYPTSKLVVDASGNLYGTTQRGGDLTACTSGGTGCGVVFKLSPSSSGSWTETVLYAFTGAADGASPYSGMISDAAGNLYGTTLQGGNNPNLCSIAGCGVVYKLSPGASGWTESVLYAFSGTDGYYPYASPILDAAGNLYGTTAVGGDISKGQGCGVVYELSPGSSGWTESLLYVFDPCNKPNGGPNGMSPDADLAMDAAGNLYGTTIYGGRPNVDQGVVYKLSHGSTGWTETVLHAFAGGTSAGTPGGFPWSGVALDPAGDVFGMAQYGGAHGQGFIFEITP